MNDVTQKYVNILHSTWENPTLLWTFKVLMRFYIQHGKILHFCGLSRY